MNEPDITKNPENQEENQELDQTQAEEVGGGGDCTITQALDSTGSLTQAYENVVAFTSHVIGRVAGEESN